jgi:hypothetical protein
VTCTHGPHHAYASSKDSQRPGPACCMACQRGRANHGPSAPLIKCFAALLNTELCQGSFQYWRLLEAPGAKFYASRGGGICVRPNPENMRYYALLCGIMRDYALYALHFHAVPIEKDLGKFPRTTNLGVHMEYRIH